MLFFIDSFKLYLGKLKSFTFSIKNSPTVFKPGIFANDKPEKFLSI